MSKKKLFSSLVLVLFVCGFILALKGGFTNSDENNSGNMLHVRKHDKGGVIKEFIKDIEDNFHDTIADKGKEEISKKCADVESLKKAIKIKPDENSYICLAELTEKSGHLQESLEYYTKAHIFNPENLQYLFKIATLSLELGDLKAADKAVASIVKIDANSQDIKELKCNLEFRKGNYEKSIESCNAVLKVKNDNAKAYNILCKAQNAIGLFDESVANCEKAVSLSPQSSDFYTDSCQAKTDAGILDKAKKDCEKAIALNPQNAQAYYYLGNLKIAENKYSDAVTDLSKAIDIAPDHKYAYSSRCLAKTKNNQKADAVSDCDTAVNINPHPMAYRNKAFNEYEAGKYAEAIKTCDVVINANSAYSDIYYIKGKSELILGDNKGAIADLTRAKELYLEEDNTDAYEETNAIIETIEKD